MNIKESPPRTTAGRPPIYSEPIQYIRVMLPASVVAWLLERRPGIAIAQHVREIVIAKMLSEQELENDDTQ